MKKYRIYIDETGNSDLNSSDNPNHRFLSLTGIIMDVDYVAHVVQSEMESLKVRYFGSHPDEPVVLHRKEMLSAQPPFRNLRNPETRKAFDLELLTFLREWNYKVITVCIDKQTHKNTYLQRSYHPYHYCLHVLLERYVFFLDSVDAVGDVMAESRGGKEDMILKKIFSRLYSNGTKYVTSERFSKRFTSSQLKIKNKANNIAGLQIADLLAHPSRNEILKENNLYAKNWPGFCAKIIEILQKKYYCEGKNCYGKKML